MKKFVIILSIKKESFDYDIILTYLRHNIHVDRLSILPQGFLIIIAFDDISARKKLFRDIIQLDIDDIMFHEICYEQFIPRRLR